MQHPATTSPRSARRRFARLPAAGADPDAWRRALCAMVFDDPARIADALSHRITGRFEIEPHHHADLLQLDVIHRCRGEATVDDKTTSLSETTFLLASPGQRHGYTLSPEGEGAAVWLIKLRVGRDGDSPLPSLVTDVTGAEELRNAAADFVRDWTPQGVGMLALSRLAQLLAVWPGSVFEPSSNDSPGSGEAANQASLSVGDGPSARVRRAVETLAPRLNDPPDLAELAEMACLSSRHFTRRFRQDFGCTPHAYLQARRLDAARGLLRDADRRVAGVADELGFSSPAAFSRWFTRLAGVSPRTFRDDPRNF
ncbi:MAG: AraC family transcriptional regulator [Planctomycetota bacterium]